MELNVWGEQNWEEIVRFCSTESFGKGHTPLRAEAPRGGIVTGNPAPRSTAFARAELGFGPAPGPETARAPEGRGLGVCKRVQTAPAGRRHVARGQQGARARWVRGRRRRQAGRGWSSRGRGPSLGADGGRDGPCARTGVGGVAPRTRVAAL